MFDKEVDLKALIKVVFKQKLVFITVLLIVSILSITYTLKQKKLYRSFVTIEIQPNTTNVLGYQLQSFSGSNANTYWVNSEYYSTQYQIIKSRAVSSKVVENLSLMSLEGFVPQVKDKNKQVSNVKFDPVAKLQSMISVVPQKESYIVQIAITNENPENAAIIANGVAEAYKEFNLEKRFIATKNAAQWLSEQSINLKDQLENSEKLLFEFKGKNGILSTSFEAKQQMSSQKINDINKRLTEKEMKYRMLISKMDEIKNVADEQGAMLVEGYHSANKLVQTLKMKSLKVNSLIINRRQFIGDKHPEMIGLMKELSDTNKSLKIEIKRIIDTYNLEAKVAKLEIRKLKNMMSSTQKTAFELNKLDIEYSKLKRNVDTSRKLYDIVMERTKEADLSALLKTNNVQIIDRALPSYGVFKPRVKMIMIVTIILALILAFIAALSVETLDTRVKSADELENVLSTPVLGILPKFSNPSDADFKELAFEGGMNSLSAESLRSIRVNIKLSDPDNNIKKMLFTSSISSEGKTTVSSNVAVGHAILGKKVLLIDTDMRRPRVHKVFNLDNKVGISSYMLNEKSLFDAIRKDVYKGLDVLTCGPVPPNPSEMIDSNKFHEMIKELDDFYDIIILDSPPVSAVTDAALLSSMVDGIIVVVKIKELSKDLLGRTIKQLKSLNTPLIGGIVNNLDTKSGNAYGSYSSYYTSKYYGIAEDDA